MTTTDTSPPAGGSKGLIWTGRVLSALPVLAMLAGVVFALTNQAQVAEDMGKYGYSESATRILIFVELGCLILYAIPQTALLGAILLTAYFGGAVATHVIKQESMFFVAIIVCIVVWLGLLLRDARLRALVPLRRLG